MPAHILAQIRESVIYPLSPAEPAETIRDGARRFERSVDQSRSTSPVFAVDALLGR
jgi:hypothetical protein